MLAYFIVDILRSSGLGVIVIMFALSAIIMLIAYWISNKEN